VDDSTLPAVMKRVLAWAAAHVLAVSLNQSVSFDPVHVSKKEHPCTAYKESKETCLTAADKCMFVELEGENRCLPCEMEKNVPNPCPPIGSVYAMKVVKDCAMKCGHQQIISKVSACEDTTGDITLAQCFAKGTSAVTKCMWTQYMEAGKLQGACGPCSVAGIGTIPCVTMGMPGPKPGTVAQLCASQCDEQCDPMLPGCSNPTSPPPAPVPAAFSPEAFKIATTDDAPTYYVTKVMPPYGVKQFENAARVGAQAAMWGPDTKQPPSAPVSIYGPPPFEGPPLPPGLPVMFGPAPPGIPGVPPPGYGVGTAPPPSMVEASKTQFIQRNALLSKLRSKRSAA